MNPFIPIEQQQAYHNESAENAYILAHFHKNYRLMLQHKSTDDAYMQALNNIGKNKKVLDQKTALIKSKIRSYKLKKY